MLVQQICLTGFLALAAALGTAAAASAPTAGAHPHTVCANCHIAGQTQAPGSNSPRLPAKRACITCHADILQSPRGGAQAGFSSTQSRHITDDVLDRKIAPLGGQSFDRLDCLSCHVPHYQGQAKLLRLNSDSPPMNAGGATFDPATRLCLSCHGVAAEVRSGGRGYVRHPVGIRVTRPGRLLNIAQLPPLADIKGTADPLDDVISCTTCHYPHASGNGFLLRWSMVELSRACLQCHSEVVPDEAVKGLADRR